MSINHDKPSKAGFRGLRLTKMLGLIKYMVVILILFSSIAINVLSFAFEPVGRVFGTIAEAIFEKGWVSTMARESAELRERNGKITQDNKALRGKLAEVEAENKKLRNSTKQARRVLDTFDSTGKRITQRTVRNAGRNLASIPLESVPFVGALTIATVTSLEINDSCATFEDIQTLRDAAGLDREDGLMSDICSYNPFSSSVLDLDKISIDACYAQAQDMAEIDPEAGKSLKATCTCIESSPGREERCFSQRTGTDQAVARPPPG